MLITQNKQINSIFERIIQDKNGALVRVRFTVVEVNGKFVGQIISAEPLETVASLFLPIIESAKVAVYNFVSNFTSTFTPFLSLEFFMSQPTRAPSFR